MSRGKNLQEMEVGTKQSRTSVNSGARSGDAMQKLAPGAVAGQSGSWEDLGGPTPENYKVDDDSAKLKTPGATLSQVKNVVNKGAKSSDQMKSLKGAVKEDEDFEDEDLIEEEIEEEIEEDDTIIEAKDEEDDEDDEDEDEDEEDEEDEEDDDEDKKNKKMKKEEFDIEEDVDALLNSGDEEDLSEEFKEKARTIFESALRSKVNEIKESLEIEYEQKLIEEITEIRSELQDRTDAYLEYVSEEWITENKLSVESGLKEELIESFLSGLKGLFEEHYVEIPEDKYDVLNSMVEKLDEMESKLNEQIEKNIGLNKRLSEAVADGIFEQVSEGLALSQKDKLASLAESVEFESEEQYREKLETLRESYFPSKTVSQMAETENLSEGVDIASGAYQSDSMNAYLRTLSAFRQN